MAFSDKTVTSGQMAKANSKRIGYNSFGIGVDQKYDAAAFSSPGSRAAALGRWGRSESHFSPPSKSLQVLRNCSTSADRKSEA
jgi:hypothetical protein